MDHDGLNKNERKITDFDEFMLQSDLSDCKSYSNPDMPSEFKKILQSTNEIKKKHTQILKTTHDDTNYSKLNTSHFNTTGKNNNDPLLTTKNLSKTSTSIRLHFFKYRYLLLVSVLFTSLSILFIKVVLHSHHTFYNEVTYERDSYSLIVFFIGVFLFLFSLFFIKLDRIDISLKRNFNKSEVDYLLIRSFLGFLTIYFIVKSLSSMRIISSSTLFYISPIISTFILLIKNKEKIKRNDRISIFATIFIILVFILQDFSYGYTDDTDNFQDSLNGVIYCLLVACLCSVNQTIDKKICHEFHSYVVLFTTSIMTVVFTPILMSIDNEKIYVSPRIVTFYFLLGASVFFSFYFEHKTIETHHLVTHSTLGNLTILLSYVFALVILEEPFTYFDIFATLIVITINLYMNHRAEECEDNDYN